MTKNLNLKENSTLLIVSILLLYTFSGSVVSASLIPKTMALLFITVALTHIIIKRNVENSINFITIATSVYVIWFGVSTLYANSGKFAINEYVNMLTGFAIFVFIVFRDKITLNKTLWTITSVAGFITFLSLEGAFVGIIHNLYENIMYGTSSGQFAEFVGYRLSSIYGVINVFATLLGTVLFLSLYMFINAKDKITKYIQGFYLVLFASCILLTTSLGGIFSLGVAVLAFLIFANEEIRTKGLIIIIQTVLIALAVVGITLVTAEIFTDAINLAPILSVFAGSVLLILLDKFTNEKLYTFLVKYMKYSLSFLIALVLIGVSLVGFLLSQTTSLSVASNSTSIRTVYLDEGVYQLNTTLNNDDNTVQIRVYTRDEIGVVTNQDVLIFNERNVTNASSNLSFEIPEGTEEVNIYITNGTENSVVVNSMEIVGNNSSKSVALAYKYIPSNITERIQGIATNDSFMTRMQYVDASIKLFMQKPLFGHGLGGFENALQSVQNYQYETAYAHNHFYQTLVDGGLIGFLTYISALASCLFYLIKSRKDNIIAPMLFGSLVMIIVHGANEFSLSIPFYIPFYFAVFALIATECAKPIENLNEYKLEGLIGVVSCMFIFTCLLAGNLIAKLNLQTDVVTIDILETNIKLDVYDTNDYYLTYVMGTLTSQDNEIKKTAYEYAQKLEKAQSNIITMYLSEYYIYTNDPAKSIELLERYIDYSINDPATWNNAISTYVYAILDDNNVSRYFHYKEEHMANIHYLIEKYYKADENSITQITLSDKTKSLLSLMLASEDMADLGTFVSYANSIAYDSDYDFDFNKDGWYDCMMQDDEYVNIAENNKLSNGDKIKVRIPYNVNSLHQITYEGDNIQSITGPITELPLTVSNGVTNTLIDMTDIRTIEGVTTGYIDLIITFKGDDAEFTRLSVNSIS